MQTLTGRLSEITVFSTRFVVPAFLAFALAGCGLFGGGGDGGGSDDRGPTAPVSPTGLSATSQDGGVELDWEAVSSADSYRVYRSTNSGVDASESPLETGLGSSEYLDDSANNGTKYYYVVTAVASEDGESAESDPSNEVEKTPFSDPPDRP